MKYLAHVAAVVLGLLFVMASLIYLLKLAPEPELPEGTPMALFMGAFGPTGYMTFVKGCELVGALLVVVPRTRILGLLVLGPILINILAFHTFITGGVGLLDPMLLVLVLAALFLVWFERKRFLALVS